jgi:hypothetical protein
MKCEHCGSEVVKFKIHPSNKFIFYSECSICFGSVVHILPQHIPVKQRDKYIEMVGDNIGKTI